MGDTKLASKNSDDNEDSQPVLETAVRGEAEAGSEVRASSPSPEPDPTPRLRTTTTVRGEGDETETKSRGELAYTEPVPERTGTFSRGESDYDQRLVSLANMASTLTHDDRGESDDNYTALHELLADDPADRRRITPLGVIAARQDAALNR
ncbi:hypothetical protein EUA06_21465 [Nocardioides glacieisoli]|uniref:Uncharacterized protein n=1 Tax=Nocardioides glacieisoli TaxID=1168730 RepID=A0A4Q2RIH3_9ACTN|nr:hypothetical protein EUA06_21465 [Nocardioides glacieisoli]